MKWKYWNQQKIFVVFTRMSSTLILKFFKKTYVKSEKDHVMQQKFLEVLIKFLLKIHIFSRNNHTIISLSELDWSLFWSRFWHANGIDIPIIWFRKNPKIRRTFSSNIEIVGRKIEIFIKKQNFGDKIPWVLKTKI